MAAAPTGTPKSGTSSSASSAGSFPPTWLRPLKVWEPSRHCAVTTRPLQSRSSVAPGRMAAKTHPEGAGSGTWPGPWLRGGRQPRQQGGRLPVRQRQQPGAFGINGQQASASRVHREGRTGQRRGGQLHPRRNRGELLRSALPPDRQQFVSAGYVHLSLAAERGALDSRHRRRALVAQRAVRPHEKQVHAVGADPMDEAAPGIHQRPPAVGRVAERRDVLRRPRAVLRVNPERGPGAAVVGDQARPLPVPRKEGAGQVRIHQAHEGEAAGDGVAPELGKPEAGGQVQPAGGEREVARAPDLDGRAVRVAAAIDQLAGVAQLGRGGRLGPLKLELPAGARKDAHEDCMTGTGPRMKQRAGVGPALPAIGCHHGTGVPVHSRDHPTGAGALGREPVPAFRWRGEKPQDRVAAYDVGTEPGDLITPERVAREAARVGH